MYLENVAHLSTHIHSKVQTYVFRYRYMYSFQTNIPKSYTPTIPRSTPQCSTFLFSFRVPQRSALQVTLCWRYCWCRSYCPDSLFYCFCSSFYLIRNPCMLGVPGKQQLVYDQEFGIEQELARGSQGFWTCHLIHENWLFELID